MKNRDRTEIIAQIIECAKGSRVRLTKIMYNVMSHEHICVMTFRAIQDRQVGWPMEQYVYLILW